MKRQLSFLCFLLMVSSIVNANIGTYGFKDFPSWYFVETGTFSGDGVRKALEAGCFKKIFSIEADLPAVRDCRNKFAQNKNISIVHGDSKTDLWNIIKNLNHTITFWLDAHIYPPVTDGRQNAPLLEELEQIKKHHIKTHTILIDDLSCCGTLAFDYLTLDDLINKIKEINPNYTIRLLDGGNDDEALNNILLAYIK